VDVSDVGVFSWRLGMEEVVRQALERALGLVSERVSEFVDER
jgi:hypothetical protein